MMKERGVRDAHCLLIGLCLLAILSVASPPGWAISGDYDDLLEGNVLVGLMAREELNLLPPATLDRESSGAKITGDLVVFGPVDGELGGTVNIEYAIITGYIGVGPGANVTVKGKNFAVSGAGKLDDPTNPTTVSFADGPGTLSVTYENGTSTELCFYYTSQDIYLGAKEPEEIEIKIDIKPGSDPNPVNPRSKGMVPVAVFSTDNFDATQIDPTTVLLAGAKVATRGKKGKLMSHPEDVDGDGTMDLMLQFAVQSEGVVWVTGQARLSGQTFDGREVEGFDEIVVVSRGKCSRHRHLRHH